MLIVDEYNAKVKRERTDVIVAAYLNAAWYRSKRMPSLEKVLSALEKVLSGITGGIKSKKSKSQTPEQMFEVIKRFHKSMEGGEG